MEEEPVANPSKKVSFIRDQPAEEDFFKTHGRLAAAIAEAIRSSPDLRVVGLVGRWGSGKSTVIKHLKNELCARAAADGNELVHVFTYDAWLHQNDPVRRSFLESLLTYLIDEDLTAREKWNEKLLELTGHIEKTEVSQSPVLTADAKWIFLSLLPLPVAVGLMDLDTIREAWGADRTNAGIVSFWFAVVAFAMPIVTILVRYAINSYKNAGADEETSLFPILMNRSVERTRSVTHRSPEPTSIEFGSMFREIMSDAAARSGRFVFVIDNLDRLTEDEALKIWATVRSFFLKSSENEALQDARTQPVVILPLDTHALERMFALSHDEGSAKERARSFINKTFDITFEVSEPVMSDWRAYLERQMKNVFGDQLKTTWVFWTRYFFENSLTSSKIRVTPREVNKLINRIAALYIQWKEEGIEFETISYFAVRGGEAQDNILEFISNPENDIDRVCEDWKRQFAALYYGVALDKAAQVLLEEPLRGAISSLDREAFSRLSKIPGFGDTFESVTTSSALNNTDNVPSFELVTNAALLLATAPADEGYWLRQSWRNLVGRYHETAGLGSVGADLVARISSFFPHLGESHEKQEFVDNTAVEIAAALSDNAEPTRISYLRDAAKSIVELSRQEGLEQPTFDLESEPPHVLNVLAKFSSEQLVWRRIRTGLDASSLVQALATALGTAPDYIVVPTVIRVLTAPGAVDLFEPAEKPEWGPVITAAGQQIRQNSLSVAVPAAVDCLGLLLRHDPSAEATIKALLDGGQLQIHLTSASGNAELQYSLIALLIWGGRNFSAPSGHTWESILKQPGFVSNLYKRLRAFIGSETMRPIWDAYGVCTSARPLFDALIRHIIDTSDLGTIPLRDIVSNPDKYLHPVPWRLRARFFWLLESYDTFWLRLEQAPLNDGLAEAAKLMAQKGEQQAKQVHELLKTRLEKVSREDWSTAIQTGTQPLMMAKELFRGSELGLGVRSELFQGLSGSIDQLISSSDRAYRIRWFDASALLTHKAEKELYERLGSALLSGQAVAKPDVLFHIGGEKLIKSRVFGDQADHTTRNIVMTLMRTKRGRAFLRDRSEDIRSLLRRSKPRTRQEVATVIKGFAAGNAEEKKYWAEVVGKDWRL